MKSSASKVKQVLHFYQKVCGASVYRVEEKMSLHRAPIMNRVWAWGRFAKISYFKSTQHAKPSWQELLTNRTEKMSMQTITALDGELSVRKLVDVATSVRFQVLSFSAASPIFCRRTSNFDALHVNASVSPSLPLYI